jgi:hypothetical protein
MIFLAIETSCDETAVAQFHQTEDMSMTPLVWAGLSGSRTPSAVFPYEWIVAALVAIVLGGAIGYLRIRRRVDRSEPPEPNS